jgi:hypothetical protein
MEPNAWEPQHNVSYEGMIKDQTSETKSLTPGSGKHIEESVTTFVEILASYVNSLSTDQLVLPLTDPPSTRYFDACSSY